MNPLCVICPNKVKLEQIDTCMFICPKCRKSYNLYYELMNYEDQLESTHEEELATIETAGLNASGPFIETLENDTFESFYEEKEKEYYEETGKIPIPDYMKSGKGKEVIEYNEEILEPE